MKLTREQVSQLSDVELNRALIWCYPPDGKFWSDPDTGTNYAWDEFIGLEQLHYLDDYNLTMPLAFDNGLSVDMSKLRFTHVHSAYEYSRHKNPLRAICEVLLIMAMERDV